MRIIIIGGGIGGVTAALTLRRAGFDARIYEQAREHSEFGAGLSIGPNVVHVLDGLGFGAALREIGIVPEGNDSFNWQTGQWLDVFREAKEVRRQFGADSYLVHRAELHAILSRDLPAEALILGATCIGVDEAGDEVIARFADGSKATGDLLIGADGVESVVQRYVVGPDAPVRPSTQAWRGLAPGGLAAEIGIGPRMWSFSGPGKSFLAYPISGEKYMNWVGFVGEGPWEHPSRIVVRERDEALADFEGWAAPVRALIAATELVTKWRLMDGDEFPTWTRGRVVLLGDAAHPMLPFAGQGAGQAIEDAVILSRCLERTPDNVAAALNTYVYLRKARASAIQARGRRGGRRSMNVEAVTRGETRSPLDWVWDYNAMTVPLPPIPEATRG